MSPTSASPTTSDPTTISPTSAAPTTSPSIAPITVSPTSSNPTSSSATTQELIPSTLSSNTITETTIEPFVPTNKPSMEPTMNNTVIPSTDIISATIPTTAEFDDEQCIVADIVFAVVFQFDRIKRKCDICLYEDQTRRQDRRCEIIENLIENFVNDYGQCMLNVCKYDCTVDQLQLNPKVTAGEEECRRGCNIFECKPQAATAFRCNFNGLLIILMIAFVAIFL